MVRSGKVFPLTLKFKGVFDVYGLYHFLHEWFARRGYEFTETYYRDRVEPFGTEITAKANAWKRYTSYLFYNYDIEFMAHHVTPVEIVVNGQKKKLYRCWMKLNIVPSLQADYQDRWEGSKFAKELANFHHKYLVFKEIDEIHEWQLMALGKKFMVAVKDYLNMTAQSYAYT
ncbi:hypothetical protein HZB02_06900 [Candidatus Woesearchaeota archaeon]|nr:hypothetical protein [Candidatus Woesearchaeota archaeon]